MYKIRTNDQSLVITGGPEIAVAETINVQDCQFIFDKTWSGLTVYSCFKNQNIVEEAQILLDETYTCKVPASVTMEPGNLYVGLLGVANGNIVKPTVWQRLAIVIQGVSPSGQIVDGNPTAIAELTQIAEESLETANEAKNTALEALNTVNEFGNDISVFEESITEKVNEMEEISDEMKSTADNLEQSYEDFFNTYQREWGISQKLGESDSLAVSQKTISQFFDYDESYNLYNPETLNVGKYINSTNGNLSDNASYDTTDYIPVTPGQIIHFQIDYNTNTGWVRYDYTNKGSANISNPHDAMCYNENKQAILSTYHSSSRQTTYTVPEIEGNQPAYIRLTFVHAQTNPASSSFRNLAIFPAENNVVLPFAPYNVTYNYVLHSNIIPQIKNKIYINGIVNTENNTQLYIPKMNIKKNVVYNSIYKFYLQESDIDNFTISMGHGKTALYSSYIKIDKDNITLYYNFGNQVSTQYPHNFEFNDDGTQNYVYMLIETSAKTLTAKITVVCNGLKKVIDSVVWEGDGNSNYFTEYSNISDVQDRKFTISCKDFMQGVYLFGDSYISLGDTSRWGTLLLNNGYTNVLMNGYGGENSTNALASLQNIITMGAKPKTIIWCMGMNDGSDSETSPSTSWSSALSSVIEICNNNNIELILATIPSVPSVNNMNKNNYVINSGYRYIDFNSAVRDETLDAWYQGMLSNDNVHPTSLGAQALYQRAIMDAPELTE